MTFRAFCGAGLVARFFFRLVALDAQLLHDSLGFQLPIFLKPGQRLRLLWKHVVADITVSKPVLMFVVLERDRAPGASIDLYFSRSFVFQG